jgi:hypothetical protein
MGPNVFMHFAPSISTILMLSSSRPRWRFSLHEVWFLRFNPQGCSFVTLWSLSPLGVISLSSQTRRGFLSCSFELVVTPSFMSMFSYKNITLPNAHTKMILLDHLCAKWRDSSIIKSKSECNEHVWCTKIHRQHLPHA